MNSAAHSADAFLESHVAFVEEVLLRSAHFRRRDLVYLDKVVSRLPTYALQIERARSLACLARRREAVSLRLAEDMLEMCAFAAPPRRNLRRTASKELHHLRSLLTQQCSVLNPNTCNLKELGWSPTWHDPDRNCLAYRNSIASVQKQPRILSIADLWNYGLVPPDLDQFYVAQMRGLGYVTDVTDALLAKHGGDWRAMLRDDSLAGQPLC